MALPVRRSRVRLAPFPKASSQARRSVAALLEGADAERVTSSLAVVVSELVNNAVLYGSRSEAIMMEVRQTQDWIEVRVQNRGKRLRMKEIRR